MEDYIVKELSKYLDKKEKILLKIFRKTFIKVYHIVRIILINKVMQ